MPTLTTGNDTFSGGAAADLVQALAGNDTVSGGGGNDTLFGGDGQDFLDGDAGNDSLDAGTSLALQPDILNGGEGNDTLNGSGAAYSDLFGGIGDDRLIGGTRSNVEGGEGADTLVGTGGFNGSILSYVGSSARVVIDLEASTASGGDAAGDVFSGFANIKGSAFNDIERGGAGANSLKGWTGRDTLVGRAGNDTLEGGKGNDTLYGGDDDDTLLGGIGADDIRGGTGRNHLTFKDEAISVSVNLTAGTGLGGSAAGDKYADIHDVTGTNASDTIFGSAANNELNGELGDDVIDGAAGNDTINGSSGNDTVRGSAGNDLFWAGEGADSVNGGSGRDMLRLDFSGAVNVNLVTGTGSGGHAEGDQYAFIEEIVSGSGNDTITGNASANLFRTNAGNDQLIGGDGSDTLEGGSGADTMNGGNGVDTMTYAGSSANINVDLGRGDGRNGDAEDDVFSNIENIICGSGNDVAGGSDLANKLDGGAGADTISGQVGNDYLLGGSGDDRLYGLTDNDRLDGGAGSDRLLGGTGSDTFDFNSVSDSTTSLATADLIFDFVKVSDHIDLRTIDARAGTVANEQFVFIGGAQFTAEGQIRSTISGNTTLVEINTTGNSGTDMLIVLNGKFATLSGTDFFL